MSVHHLPSHLAYILIQSHLQKSFLAAIKYLHVSQIEEGLAKRELKTAQRYYSNKNRIQV